MTALMLLAIAAIAQAIEPAGPPVPVPSKVTPAEQAMANYRAEWAHRAPAPCPPRGRDGEIVVCGDGRGNSPDRLPLPEERGPPDHARLPIGEVPSARGALVESNTAPQPLPGGDAPAIRAAEKLLAKAARAAVGADR